MRSLLWWYNFQTQRARTIHQHRPEKGWNYSVLFAFTALLQKSLIILLPIFPAHHPMCIPVILRAEFQTFMKIVIETAISLLWLSLDRISKKLIPINTLTGSEICKLLHNMQKHWPLCIPRNNKVQVKLPLPISIYHTDDCCWCFCPYFVHAIQYLLKSYINVTF